MPIGPVQLLVVGFENPNFRGEILAELERLRENETVRLIDLLVVRKNEDGSLDKVQISDLDTEEAMEFGAIVGALIGLGAGGEEGAEAGAEIGAAMGEDNHILPGDIWYVDEVVPVGTAAAVALIEHRWALPLRDKIRDAGGFHIADAWIHPLDLVAIGLASAEEAEQVG
jgi:uncharacterized membrane protein